jgi:signal transduction histidine kinase
MRLVAWNQRYLDIFQYPEGMVCVGRPIAEIIHYHAERGECGPGDPAHQVEKRLSRMRNGSSYVAQRERLSGRIYEIRGQAMPGGGYVRTYTDITEFKKTERELLEAKQGLEQRVEQRTLELRQALEAQEAAKRQAESANLSKTRFVAALTHDLLQPLNAARLFSAALESRVVHDTELSALVSRIGTAMRAAEELLAGLLDIARLDSGALQPQLSEFPIAELVADLERQYAPLASSRGLQLRAVPSGVWVKTDRVLLRRVLQNLIGNALRYTAHGAVLVGCRRHGGEVELQVFDTGPGIAAEQQEAIFGEFRRLEQRSPWGEQGVGLGLAICERIARLLGHTLLLRSRVGRGSMFAIRVTRVAVQIGRPAELGTLAEPGDLGGMRVLCVDNDPAILEGMKVLLSRWGVNVECALDPREAVELSTSQRFDAVLADYHLQGQMNGLELLQRYCVAASPVERMRCTLPVLITADHDPWLMNETRRLGHALLLKPLKPAALRALLASHKSSSCATAVCRVAASLPATNTA